MQVTALCKGLTQSLGACLSRLGKAPLLRVDSTALLTVATLASANLRASLKL